MSARRKGIVTIDARTVGEAFATIGIVRRNGRIIYRGIERPYRYVAAALGDARDWAEAHGYRVAVDAEAPEAEHYHCGQTVRYAGRLYRILSINLHLIGGPHYRLSALGDYPSEDLTAHALITPEAP